MENRILFKKLNNFLYGMNEKDVDEDFKSEIIDIIEELEGEIEDLEGTVSNKEIEIDEMEEDRDIWKEKFNDLEYDYRELTK